MNKHHNKRNTEIDVERVVRYLNYKFNDLTGQAADNSRGTDLYKKQVEFNYLIHDIQKAPRYSVGKIITQANTFLAGIEAETPKSEAA
ncbi:MAG: hypothetical protein JXR12_01230 [Neptunomonas phycophila]|uniref:hypothetical protein n=1 Tax=Neptunomonas phycophila TaxID=1572645 RepID=UPI003B8C2EAD